MDAKNLLGNVLMAAGAIGVVGYSFIGAIYVVDAVLNAVPGPHLTGALLALAFWAGAVAGAVVYALATGRRAE